LVVAGGVGVFCLERTWPEAVLKKTKTGVQKKKKHYGRSNKNRGGKEKRKSNKKREKRALPGTWEVKQV